MVGSVSSDQVAALARVARFNLGGERCSLLAPQLEWLLSEAAKIESLDLSADEPVNVFRPGETITEIEAEGEVAH